MVVKSNFRLNSLSFCLVSISQSLVISSATKEIWFELDFAGSMNAIGQKIACCTNKKRGFCGSCLAWRMSETSVRLVDSLIPHIPTRQWVLSVPAPLRYLIVYDHNALNAVLSAFTGALFAYLRKNVKAHGGRALEAHGYFPGAVTFIQRFGSGLNLNVHVHSQVSDGAYVQFGDNKIHFMRITPPRADNIRRITNKIAKRVHKYLERRACLIMKAMPC